MRSAPWVFVQELMATWSAGSSERSAAALAYYSMFSFAPMLYVALTVAGMFIDEVIMNEQVYARLATVLGAESAEFIREMVLGAAPAVSGGGALSSLVSLGALLYGATGLFANLKQSLNLVWQVPPSEQGGLLDYMRTRLLAFGLVLGVGLLLVLATLISIALSIFTTIMDFGYPTLTGNVVSLVVLITLTFAVLYRVLPDVEIAWREVWPGALLAAVLFAIGRWGLAIYFSYGGVGSAFEAAGTLAIVLIAVYYGAQIFLFGAVFTKVYAARVGAEPHPAKEAL